MHSLLIFELTHAITDIQAHFYIEKPCLQCKFGCLQEVPAPVRSPVQEAMPMRPQWGFESYMQQPMQSPQDAYMWTWPMQPMQYQEWVWPMMPPQQQAPMCSEAFAAAGHIAPELQGLTREQVAAVLKEAAQGLRYED